MGGISESGFLAGRGPIAERTVFAVIGWQLKSQSVKYAVLVFSTAPILGLGAIQHLIERSPASLRLRRPLLCGALPLDRLESRKDLWIHRFIASPFSGEIGPSPQTKDGSHCQAQHHTEPVQGVSSVAGHYAFPARKQAQGKLRGFPNSAVRSDEICALRHDLIQG